VVLVRYITELQQAAQIQFLVLLLLLAVAQALALIQMPLAMVVLVAVDMVVITEAQGYLGKVLLVEIHLIKAVAVAVLALSA
jgi:hypothetical protein